MGRGNQSRGLKTHQGGFHLNQVKCSAFAPQERQLESIDHDDGYMNDSHRLSPSSRASSIKEQNIGMAYKGRKHSLGYGAAQSGKI
jgi:hypothetical protein